MDVPAVPAHVPALGHHERTEVEAQLQTTLLELVDLALVGKQLHWSVTGAHFRSLHLQLDDLVRSWRELADLVAERCVAIGSWPDGQASALAAATGFSPLERGAIEDKAVIRELSGRLADVAERVRTRTDRLGRLDVASQDVLTTVLREVERQLWMVRAQHPQ